MQIVIDIPEEMWEQVKDGYVPLGISKYLKNGTPQPKIGHWEYVQYDCNPNIGNWHCSACRSIVIECADKNIPTYNYCPNCGAKMNLESEAI